MSPGELFYHSARCLALDRHPEYTDEIHSYFNSEKISLDDFVSLCDSHLVLPAIYLNLKNHGLLQYFPEEYSSHLAAIYLGNKQRNLTILSQVEEINSILGKEGIKPIYLKGTGNLLANVYKDMGERLIGDIDILVHENDFLPAAAILKQNGYNQPENYFGDITRSKHYPRLTKNGWPCDVEIHRIAVEPEYSRFILPETIFEKMDPVDGLNNCFVPCDEHKALINFIHAQLANLGHRFRLNALRDLYDMYLLMERIVPEETKVAPKIKTRWEIWVKLTSRVFSNNFISGEIMPEKQRCFFTCYDWYKDHPKIHRIFLFIVKITELVVNRPLNYMRGYSGGFSFVLLARNLGNRQWYEHVGFRIRNFYMNYLIRRE